MKYIITFLLLCASTVFGAVPSFQAFDANFFQITGTGNNSIKIKTNNYTWAAISGGSGDSVWTNSAGVIQPVSTNVIKIQPNGTIRIGRANVFGSTGSGVGFNSNSNDPPIASLFVDVQTNSSVKAVAVLLANVTPGSSRSEIYQDATTDDYATYLSLRTETDAVNNKLVLEGVDLTGNVVLNLEPTAADGTTPYTFDTSVNHTSGNLVEVKNATTEVVSINYAGTVSIGETAPIQLSGDATFAEARLEEVDSENAISMFVDGSAVELQLEVASTTRTRLRPSVGVSTTPYVFDTSIAHTSGNLLEVKNSGTNKFSVAWDGTVNIDQANIGSATFTNVYFLNPIIGSNGVASYAANAPVAITASGWTNSYSVNAIAEIDAAAADLKYFIKNSAGTGVYTNLASSTVWHATAILQPGGAVVITAGTTPSGTARPF